MGWRDARKGTQECKKRAVEGDKQARCKVADKMQACKWGRTQTGGGRAKEGGGDQG